MSAASYVVSDTGPISYLHRLGRPNLLPSLYGRVIVPTAVTAELSVGRLLGHDLPDVASLDWVDLRSPPAAAQSAFEGLGAGEAESIALAKTIAGALVLLDDGDARRLAASLGLRVTGTLGVLLAAKGLGLVPLVAPEIERLQELGFRLSGEVRRTVLERAGE